MAGGNLVGTWPVKLGLIVGGTVIGINAKSKTNNNSKWVRWQRLPSWYCYQVSNGFNASTKGMATLIDEP